MAVWELTLRCDLACGHCGSRAGKPRSAELSTEEALDVVRQLRDLEVREVALIGGEAYLRSDWDEIARAISAGGMLCSMVTGGRGFDLAQARRARRAGVCHVAVSIDGLETRHDQQRGVRGSYRAAIDALANLRSVGLRSSVNSQVNRISLPDLPPLLETVAREGIWSFAPALTVAMGRAVDHADWLLQPFDLLTVFPQLASLKRRCVELGIEFAPGNNIGYFGPFESLLRSKRNDPMHWTGCAAGVAGIGIEANGALKGCPSLPSKDYTRGNVRDTSIAEMLRNKRLAFEENRGIEDLWGHCRSCYYARTCKAGCTWTSHVLFGRPGNNPYCHYRALQLQKRGLRERLIPVESAKGEPFDYGRFALLEEPIPTERQRSESHDG